MMLLVGGIDGAGGSGFFHLLMSLGWGWEMVISRVIYIRISTINAVQEVFIETLTCYK